MIERDPLEWNATPEGLTDLLGQSQTCCKYKFDHQGKLVILNGQVRHCVRLQHCCTIYRFHHQGKLGGLRVTKFVESVSNVFDTFIGSITREN